MNGNNIGIKSIDSRLKELEKRSSKNTYDDGIFDDGFENKLVLGIKKSKEETTKKELNKIKIHFIEGINNNHIGEFKNVFKIVEIEKNIKKIAILMDTSVSSSFKLQTAITLITEILGDIDLLIIWLS
eukprot:Lithocolla_globosa_v1_NODE_224_length_5048_cov_4.479976.p4 type:complete len:128 gc:universal NODE_224_length_5048_cov_4.479976:467-850(+)